MIEREAVLNLIRRIIARVEVEMRIAATKADYSTVVNCQAGILELELLIDDVEEIPEAE